MIITLLSDIESWQTKNLGRSAGRALQDALVSFPIEIYTFFILAPSDMSIIKMFHGSFYLERPSYVIGGF